MKMKKLIANHFDIMTVSFAFGICTAFAAVSLAQYFNQKPLLERCEPSQQTEHNKFTKVLNTNTPVKALIP